MKKKILIVLGTRPEAIKMAPLIKQLASQSDYFDLRICITSQHREMLKPFLDIFEIVPDYDLDIMKKEQDLYDITVNVLNGMKKVLKNFQPDLVFVQGDTTTTFAAALTCFYEKIDVAHIEAGLRTYNHYDPFPEEMNRQLTSRMTRYHFAPTEKARQNLLQEGIASENIIVTGNTVIDALLWMRDKIKTNKTLTERIENKLKSILQSYYFDIQEEPYILVTGHRRENFGEGFKNICHAIKEIALQHPSLKIIYPVHLNPNVRKPVGEILKNIDNVILIEPLNYEEFIYLMAHAKLILTDSGGVQEEAPSLGKPVLVMRNTTERTEALDAGTVKLVGVEKEKIVTEINMLLGDKSAYAKMSEAINPYGDGKAAQRIVSFLLEEFK